MEGALWHIFYPRDVGKLRMFLSELAVERDGSKQSKHQDVIHDQCLYLNDALLSRLYKKYEVKPYTQIQYVGDAIVIPAGSPHQVQNLNNCIKIAIDFVSPENVAECYRLSEEFRNLSEDHTNREDKLQLKNIIYHTMKAVIPILKSMYYPAHCMSL